MTKLKKILTIAFTALLAITLTACGASNSNSNSGEKKEIKIGATSGPYADMVNKGLKPLLEKKGYKVTVTEFSDYIQPNKALNNGEIDANLFQHKIYMKKFAETNKMDLTALTQVPTAPMGLYSDKVKDLKDLPEGAEVTLPNDPSNAARAYALLAAANVIKIKPDTDVLKITKNDVIENPKNLKFSPISLLNLNEAYKEKNLVFNYPTYIAKLNLTPGKDGLLVEDEKDSTFAVSLVAREDNKDSDAVKALKKALASEKIKNFINEKLKGHATPAF